MASDLYAILGVDFQATQAEIKDAFRRASMMWHPDRVTGDAERFKDVAKAYEILGDPELRARYDATGLTEKPQPAQSMAKMIIAEALLNVIDQIEPTQIDLVLVVRQFLEQAIGRGESTNANLQQQINKRLRAQMKLARQKDGENLLVTMLEADIVGKRQTIAQNEIRIEQHREALSLLEDYTLEELTA